MVQAESRITASKLKQAIRTNADKPAKSLIKAICYPESNRFSTAATRYGCKHEAQARKDYEKIMRELHDGYSIADSGLCLNAKLPFMGASPYGIVVYSCHGTGVCEIKFPHCHQDKENIRACAGEKGFCLAKDGDKIKLDRSHAYYYYQIKAQLFILQVDYCDFIVWNKNYIFIERICLTWSFGIASSLRLKSFFRNVSSLKFWQRNSPSKFLHLCSLLADLLRSEKNTGYILIVQCFIYICLLEV